MMQNFLTKVSTYIKWPLSSFKIYLAETTYYSLLYSSTENIHTPPAEGIGIYWGVGGSVRPQNLKKCMELILNFQSPSIGEVWIFSGITHCLLLMRSNRPFATVGHVTDNFLTFSCS